MPFNKAVVNTASFTTTSLPGANGTVSATPGTPGSTTGKRTGSGVAPNDLTGTGSATVTTQSSALTKEIVSPKTYYAIGDILTYRITLPIPIGTTTNFLMTDVLPSGLIYNGTNAVTYTPAGGFTPITPAFNWDAGTRTLTWNFGSSVTATSAGTLQFTYDVKVDNVIANQDNVNLPNFATLTFGAGNTVISNTVNLTVGEPNLTLTKTLASGSGALPGKPASWTITVVNTGHTTAYQVNWRDVLPNYLYQISNATLTPSGNVYLNATTTPLATGHFVISTTTNTNDTIALPLFQIDPGATMTITFDCMLSDKTPSEQALVNAVRTNYNSQPSGTNVRDNSSGAGSVDDDNNTDLNNYEESVSTTLTAGTYQLDFGDVPDTYKTLLTSGGARHITTDGSNTWLGTGVDNESDGQPNTTATGDVADEDGIVFLTPIQPGQPYQIQVTASTSSVLNAWIDFNGNGQFDAGEQILTNKPLTAGVNTFGSIDGLTAPLFDPETVTTLYSRFRVTKNTGEGGNMPDGLAYSGEVEDYALMTLGDIVWKDNGIGGGSPDDGILNGGESGIAGVSVDLRVESTSGSGTFDVVFASTTTDAGGRYSFPGLMPGRYKVNIPADQFASGGLLYNYVSSTAVFDPEKIPTSDHADENTGTDDGVLGGVSSPVITMTLGGEPIGDGDNDANSNRAVDFGFFRYDYGDLPEDATHTYGTTLASDPPNAGARHIIDGLTYLGADVDGELDGQHNATALGDDSADSDDENGVTFLTPIMPGEDYQIRVNASVAGYLNAWIDFNGDGDFDDTGEQIIIETDAQGQLIAGNNTITLTAPATPDPFASTLYARFRFTKNTGEVTAPTGLASNGEVEDYALMSLGNVVWFDEDNDGIKDALESGIANVDVELYTSTQTPGTSTPIATTVTDANGNYLFTGLTSGTYKVHIPKSNFNNLVEPLYNYVSSSDRAGFDNPDNDRNQDADENGLDDNNPAANGITTGTVTLSLGDEPVTDDDTDANSNLTVDFGFYEAVSLGNRVWFDLNYNGVIDTGEKEIAGVTVNLLDSSGIPVKDVNNIPITATTDANGHYLFTQLLPGDYRVEIAASNFQTGGVLEVYLSTRVTQSISNTDIDSDDNGIDDFNPAINGIRSSTVSLAPNTEPTSEVDLGSKGHGNLDTENSNLTVDFGFIPANPGSIGDVVWLDIDGDGLQDIGESGIANVEVKLFDNIGNLLATTVTDSNGRYLFSGLFPGTYSVQVTPATIPAGLVSSYIPPALITINTGDNNRDADFGYKNTSGKAVIGDLVWNDTNGNGVRDAGEPGIGNVTLNLVAPGTDGLFGTADDVVKATQTTLADGSYLFANIDPGKYIVEVTDTNNVLIGYNLTGGSDPTPPITVAANDVYLNADFGYQNPTATLYKITDTVWHDLNENGIKDAGENAIAGVTVNLLNSSGVVIATAVTDSSGNFTFTGLANGTYTVKIADTDNKLVGYLGTTTDAKAGQKTVPVFNADVTGINFGYNATGTIGDTVFSDANGDKIQNPGEPGISGVSVKLYKDNGDGVFDSTADTLVKTAATDTAGKYLFTGLDTGTYFVSVDDTQAKLASYSPTTTDMETGANAAGTQIEVLLPNANSVFRDADFGYRNNTLPNVSGYIWSDLDKDGIDNGTGEPQISGVTVALKDLTGKVIATTTTDADGYYEFSGVEPGNYTIEVTDTANVLNGYTLTGDGTGLWEEPLPNIYSITVASDDITDKDFGYVKSAETGTIGDLLFNDTDGDGVKDANENGIPNVSVKLWNDNNNNGVIDTGDTVFDTEITNSGGNYLFTNLPAGFYIVDVDETTLPPGMFLTTNNEPHRVDLSEGENYLLADFGYQPMGNVTGHLFIDTNGNGTQDGGEPNLANIDVVITDAYGGTRTVSSDANGNYTAYNVPAGNVIVDVNTNDPDFPPGHAQTAGVDPNTVSVTNGATANAGNDGYQPRGNITGHLFIDTNGNGTQDSGEPNLANIDVVITDAFGGTRTVISDANGNYTAANIPAGNATVNVNEADPDFPAGHVQTAGTDPSSVTVPTNGTGNAGNDGYQPRGNVTGHLFIDTNGNGTQDSGEPNLANIDVVITDAFGGTHTVSSDANGNYTVNNIPAGNATVNVNEADADFPAGHVQTAGTDPSTVNVPANGTGDAGNDGYQPRISGLGDTIWHDTNANGIQDSGEIGIPGVPVQLFSSTGTFISSTTTDANGKYIFADLSMGDYYVQITLPCGYKFAPQNQGNDDSKDSDTDVTTGKTDATHIDVNENDPTWDSGLYQPASIGDFVWNDLNVNGIQDSGEIGISGVTVKLFNSAGTEIATTVTDNNGKYAFTNLVPGDYYVEFTAPTGYKVSPQDQGNNDSNDSDINPATGRTPVTTLISGESDLTWDAGLYYASSISDLVWNDVNGNGIQDSNETGIEGVGVKLFNSSGTEIANTVTDISGKYIFANLAPGDYYLEFTPPSGYKFTQQNQGTDDIKDSDADTATGKTPVTTITPGENDSSWDVGLYKPLNIIGDLVWNDTNTNGIQDNGETGIPGVKVTLFNGTGVEVAGTVTDSSGKYDFTNIAPGDYYLEFTAPDGYEFSPQNKGDDDTADSDADTTTGRTPVTSVTASENDLTWDAGLYNTASIGDLVWNDINADGIQNNGEKGVSGIIVRLFNASDTELANTTTDTDGKYLFSNLAPGEYYLEFTLPSGYKFSPRDNGNDDTADSDVNTATGKTALTTITAGENDLAWDAGIYQPVNSIGDLVWHDLDANGIQDSGENGIADVTVKLFTGSGTEVAVTTTDSDGIYSFANIAAGDYYLEFTAPDGYDFSPQNTGNDDTQDSDADTATGRTSQISLSAAENDLSWDAGLYQSAELGNYIWYDANENGIQDAGEKGVAGVNVNLINPATGNLLDSAVTDGSGYYKFTNLVPGDYGIEFIPPEGYIFSPQNEGSGALQDVFDSDADTVTGRTSQITLSSGGSNLTLDTGIFIPDTKPAYLGDYVWYDTDKNGIQDAGEKGVSGVTVYLINPLTDEILATAITNGSGLYLFEGLIPGNYAVEFELPADYIFTASNKGSDDAADSDADIGTGRTGRLH